MKRKSRGKKKEGVGKAGKGARKKVALDQRNVGNISTVLGKIEKLPRHPLLPIFPTPSCTNKSTPAYPADTTTSTSGVGTNKISAGVRLVVSADEALAIVFIHQSGARLIIASDTRSGSPLAANPPRGWYRSSLARARHFSYIKRTPQGHCR